MSKIINSANAPAITFIYRASMTAVIAFACWWMKWSFEDREQAIKQRNKIATSIEVISTRISTLEKTNTDRISGSAVRRLVGGIDKRLGTVENRLLSIEISVAKGSRNK